MNNLPPPLPSTSNWWQRNWLWAVPTGCVTLLAAFVVFGGSIFLLVMSFMRSSEPYKAAIQRTQNNAQVINALGTPINEGWFTTGSINVSGTSGRANLAISIAGPKGKATVYVVANKAEGVWQYHTLNMHVDGTGETIDLR